MLNLVHDQLFACATADQPGAGKCVGKYDDIEKLQRAGELKTMLKEAGR